MKESVQDALSDFFYSCAGRERERGSKYSARQTPDKDSKGIEERSYARLSQVDSEVDQDDQGHPRGEIRDESQAFEPIKNRGHSQFLAYSARG